MYSERQLRRAAEKSKKWFDAASKLPRSDRPLGRLIHEGDNHIRTVEKMQSNMRPLTSGGGRPANDRLIARHLRGWKTKVAGWKASREAKAAREAAAREANAPRDDGNSAPPGRLASVSAFPFNTAAPAFVPSFPLPPAPPAIPHLRYDAATNRIVVNKAAQAPPASAPELPEAFTAAVKWFRTANGLLIMVRGEAPPARMKTLLTLADKGSEQIQAVQATRSSYPPGSRATIAWRCLKWKDELSCWEVAALETALHVLREARIGVKMRDTEKRLVEAKSSRDKMRSQLERFKPTWRKHRAEQRKKRTCSMCGKTAPNSSRAFPYCGGCRDPSIPRVDRPRYCSEECQRAHWLAGHMDRCLCCTG